MLRRGKALYTHPWHYEFGVTALLNQMTKNKEEALVLAALKVFRRKGYHSATIADIAAEAGIQKGSVYYYVASKETLLTEALARDMDLLNAAMEGISHADMTPEEKLRQAIGAHIHFVTEHPDGLTVAVQDFHSISPERRAEVVATRDRYEVRFREIIEEGVRNGDFASVDASLVTFAILGMCNYLCLWYRPEGRSAAREIADTFSNLVLGGLLSTGTEEDLRRVHRVERNLARRVSRLRDSVEAFREAQLGLLLDMDKVLSGE